MINNRMQGKPSAWSNSAGAFGICVTISGHDADDVLHEIEMTSEELIEMATDMLVLANLKKGRSITIPHSNVIPEHRASHYTGELKH